MNRFLVLLCVSVSLAAVGDAPPLTEQLQRGVVCSVVDGDTLWVVLDGGTTLNVRFAGVDTPELHVGGEEPPEPGAVLYSRLTTEHFLPGTVVWLRVVAEGSYGRSIAEVYDYPGQPLEESWPRLLDHLLTVEALGD